MYVCQIGLLDLHTHNVIGQLCVSEVGGNGDIAYPVDRRASLAEMEPRDKSAGASRKPDSGQVGD